MDNSNSRDDILHDEALLDQLEREKEMIESIDHNGFADAVRRNRIEGEISELDAEICRIKQRPVAAEG